MNFALMSLQLLGWMIGCWSITRGSGVCLNSSTQSHVLCGRHIKMKYWAVVERVTENKG
jgi:hypothetical protein